MKKLIHNERGSLALEHILFIVGVAAIAGAVAVFYGDIATWFGGVGLPAAPQL